MFIALGGSSYAAIKITGSNVANSSLTGADIKNSSLTGSDVKNASLLADDFKAGELPAGAQGPAGPAGPAGSAGPQGAPGATDVVARRRDTLIASGTNESASIQCETGERAVGGGAGMSGLLNGTTAIYFDEPLEADGTLPEAGDVPTGWRAGGGNSSAIPQTMNLHVLCVSP